MRRTLAASGVLLGAFFSMALAHAGSATAQRCSAARDEVFVPAGRYAPFFKRAKKRDVPVAPMCLGAAPVTNAEFLAFVRKHPEWRRSRVAQLLAEGSYLASWRDDLTPPAESLTQPVTQVSWFAAGAYCESLGFRLPKVAEWERVAGARVPASSTAPLAIAMGKPAADLQKTPLVVGGIWEWTEDFNSAVVSGRASSAQGTNTNLFCGGGILAEDSTDYGAFLRYSFRSSLRAAFTLKNLGFRCTREAR